MRIQYYNSPFELPAFNYYQADNDIKYMLKNSVEKLSDVEISILINALFDIKEWFAKGFDQNAYNDGLIKRIKINHLQNEVLVHLSAIESIYNSLLDGNIERQLKASTIQEIKRRCQLIGSCGKLENCAFDGCRSLGTCRKRRPLVYLADKLDMLDAISRFKKGVNLDLQRELKKINEIEVEFNFIREATKIKKLGYNFDTMSITLAEWLQTIKLVGEDGTSRSNI